MKYLLNCPNCAAPIKSDICPYCGSVFLDWASFDIERPTFVRVRHPKTGHFRIMKLATVSANTAIEPQVLYSDDRIECIVSSPDIRINAEFLCVPFNEPISGQAVMAIDIDPNVVSRDDATQIIEGTRLEEIDV